jgi:hypothetical protein
MEREHEQHDDLADQNPGRDDVLQRAFIAARDAIRGAVPGGPIREWLEAEIAEACRRVWRRFN